MVDWNSIESGGGLIVNSEIRRWRHNVVLGGGIPLYPAAIELAHSSGHGVALNYTPSEAVPDDGAARLDRLSLAQAAGKN